MNPRTSYPVARHLAQVLLPSHGKAPHPPRSRRRGIATLTATLFLAGILLGLSSLWAVGQARQKIAGEAALVGEAIARAGYGLHHWLHEARNGPGFTTPAEHRARRLTGAEETGRTTHGAWTSRMQPPRRWRIIPFIGMPGDQAWDTPLPHGILIVRPPDCTTERDQTLHSEVAQRLGVAINPEDYDFDFNTGRCNDVPAAGPVLGDVQNIPTEDYDLVVYAHALSRIDPSLVLREPRAGFAPPVMETALDMGGHDITGTATLDAGEALTVGTDVDAVEADKINGALLIEAGDPALPPRLDITGDLDVTGSDAIVTVTTLGRDSDPTAINANYGAVDRIPGAGSAPVLRVTDPDDFFCGTCSGGTP